MQLSPFNPNDVIDSESSSLNCPACGSKQIVAGLMQITNSRIEIPVSCNLCGSETIRSYKFLGAHWDTDEDTAELVTIVEPCIGFESEAITEAITEAPPEPKQSPCYVEINDLHRQIKLLEERNQSQERHINILTEINNLLSPHTKNTRK